MRGILLGVVFFGALPFIFVKGPFFGILMWYWLSMMNPQKLVWYGIASQVPYDLIVAIATFLAWAMTRSEPRTPPLDKTTVLLLLLMFWISVTSVVGIGPPDQIFDKWQLTEKMLLMTMAAYILTNTQPRVDQLIAVVVLSIAFYGLRGGVFAILTGGAFRVYGPSGTMTGDNNDLGVALTMTLPLLFYLRERYSRPALKWPMLALIGLTVCGDIFTYSRGALVAVIAMSGVLWLRSRKKVATLFIIIIAAVGIWNFAPEQWFKRMLTIETYQHDQSAESRLYMWQLAFAMAEKSPILGGGFHWSYNTAEVNRELADSGLPKMRVPRAPHSIWFEMMGDHGFVGLAIFVAILLSAALDGRWLIRHSRGDPSLLWANNLGRMLQAALVGYCAGASFATLATYDGIYAVVIIAAIARRLVAAELASRQAAAADKTMLAVARPPGRFSPQPTG